VYATGGSGSLEFRGIFVFLRSLREEHAPGQLEFFPKVCAVLIAPVKQIGQDFVRTSHVCDQGNRFRGPVPHDLGWLPFLRCPEH
jgi:hypothetical protein